jgi:hypothetical protein
MTRGYYAVGMSPGAGTPAWTVFRAQLRVVSKVSAWNGFAR